MLDSGFKKKFLYRQETHPDYPPAIMMGSQELEGVDAIAPETLALLSQTTSMWAVSWVYPGAISSITARIKVSVLKITTSDAKSTYEGFVEVWKEKGWHQIECVFPTDEHFSVDEVEIRLMKMVECFYTGQPIDDLSGYDNLSRPSYVKNKNKAKKENIKEERKKEKKKKNEKDSEDEGDAFDWV